jgi:membrane protease YdiL (CAAX protease family)
VYGFCVVASWTLGDWGQRRHYALGLAVTELACLTLPAILFLHRHRALLDLGPFGRPAVSDLVRSAVMAPLAMGLAVATGLALRRGLDLPGVRADIPLGALLVLWIWVPFSEELLFRPVLQRVLLFYGRPGVGIVVTALLFGLLHRSWLRFGETFILGLIGGLIFMKSGTWWPCVVFHGLANVTGPLILKHGEALGWLFQPAALIGQAAAMIGLVATMGPGLPSHLRGAWPRLGWILFRGRLEVGIDRWDRRMVVALGTLAVAMAVVLTVGLPGELAYLQGHARLSAATQTERWTLQRGGMVRARSRVEFKNWPSQQPLLVELAYAEARPLVVQLSGAMARWQVIGAGRLEVWVDRPLPEFGEKSLEVHWEIPLSAMARGAGYGARLWPLFAVSQFTLVLALDPVSGYEFAGPIAGREAVLAQLEFQDWPRDTELGYRDLGVRREIPVRPKP